MDITDEKIRIDKIQLAICVKSGMGDRVHSDRASHGLAYNVTGEKIYKFDTGLTVINRENGVIYLPKHSNYRVDTITDGDCYAINFDSDSDIDSVASYTAINDTNTVSEIFRTACNEWKRHGSGYQLKLKALLYDLLYEMRRQSPDTEYSPRFKRIIPAAEYIDRHYTDPNFSIEALSDICSVSGSYLRRVFAEKYGEPPVKYLIRKRMELAKRLLSVEALNVKETGVQCGFRDPSSFTRAFCAYYGHPPTARK